MIVCDVCEPGRRRTRSKTRATLAQTTKSRHQGISFRTMVSTTTPLPQVAPGPPLLLDLVRPRRVVALVFSQVAHLVSWPVFVARLLDHAFIVSGDGKRSGVLETQALTVTLKELVSFVFQLNTQHTLDSNLPRVPS